MAPIPTSPNNSPAAVDLFWSWFMWLLVVILAIFGVALLGWLVRWTVTKVRQILATRKTRKAEDKLVLPTHLNPFVPRAMVLPLPCPYAQEACQERQLDCMHEKEERKVQSTIDKVRIPRAFDLSSRY